MAASMRFLWLVILSLCCLFNCSDAGHAKKKALPSAIVVGTVFCDTRFHEGISKSSHFIAGAPITVECWDSSTKSSFLREVQTNRHGKFEIRLPQKTNAVSSCSVKLIRSNERFCSVAASSRASINKLRLESARGGVHVFSAGLFAFTSLSLSQNPNFQGSNSLGRNPNQRAFFFLPSPPLPILPSPPNVGGVPLPPNPVMPQPPLLPPLPTQPAAPPNTGGVPLPPNPLMPQPPNTGGVPLPPNPVPLPPNPLMPQPPNTGGVPLPPDPLIPQPPPLPLPPIPIITPPPAPPPSTVPRIPFPPNPLFPGIPPASSSKGVPP